MREPPARPLPFPSDGYAQTFWYRARAREIYGSNEVEVEEFADVSIAGNSTGDTGAWVEAWVWVPKPDERKEA